jgi:hypothetical protein
MPSKRGDAFDITSSTTFICPVMPQKTHVGTAQTLSFAPRFCAQARNNKAPVTAATGARRVIHPPWPGYPLSGCSPAEPDSVSPGAVIVIETCWMTIHLPCYSSENAPWPRRQTVDLRKGPPVRYPGIANVIHPKLPTLSYYTPFLGGNIAPRTFFPLPAPTRVAKRWLPGKLMRIVSVVTRFSR